MTHLSHGKEEKAPVMRERQEGCFELSLAFFF